MLSFVVVNVGFGVCKLAFCFNSLRQIPVLAAHHLDIIPADFVEILSIKKEPGNSYKVYRHKNYALVFCTAPKPVPNVLRYDDADNIFCRFDFARHTV